MLAVNNCELKNVPIVIGSLVTHIYNPENEFWVAVDGNAMQNDKILWRSSEVGLVLRVDVLKGPRHGGVDILISVMIPAGTGYCFGSDVNMI